MKHEAESSLWKSLAVAFGDGLAFGAGIAIAQASPRSRQRTAGTEPAVNQPPEPQAVTQPEPESLDLQILSKILAKIDATLATQMAQVEERLTAAEAFQAAQQAQLNARQQTRLEEFRAALAGRIETMQQEVEAGNRTREAELEERLGRYVDARTVQLTEEMEARLHRDISEAGDRTAKLLVDTIEMRLLSRIALLEGEVRGQAEIIRSLRNTSDGSRRKIHDLLAGFGQACRDAVDELERTDPAPPAGDAEVKPEKAAEPQDPVDHRFDSLKLVNYQPRQEKRMVVPLVSSITAILLAVAALGSGAIW